MTRRIDSAALDSVRRTLALGRGGAGVANLDDGNVSQVLEVNPAVRRSLSLLDGGLSWVAMQAIMPGAAGGNEVETITLDPYRPKNPRASGPFAALPESTFDRFDFWLIGCQLQFVSGSTAFQAAQLFYVIAEEWQYDSSDQAGAAVPGDRDLTLAWWDTETQAGLSRRLIREQANPIFTHLGIRLPNPHRAGPEGVDEPLGFRVMCDGSAATNVVARLLVGIHPIATGTDVAK